MNFAEILTIRRLEEITLSALPALQTAFYDGWVLRASQGYTRRANSVNPIYPSSQDVNAKIDFCEQWFAAHNLPTIFKLTPAAQPDNLDALLEERGYTREAETRVKVMTLDSLESSPAGKVELLTQPNNEWQSHFFRMNGVKEQFFPVMQFMLKSISLPICCAAVIHQNQVVAVGLGVLDDGFVSLYDIVTAPEQRNQGLGKQLLLHLLNWGKAQGARQACLAVVAANAPAVRLYDKLGFREVYPYWYRVLPHETLQNR
ncbi:MAG: GNAT family N-acetyltransferase [Anaerolineae bacterium]|nr:GNAT family N-acetyltransferase [Anaerolineae bacterium]